MGDTSNNEIVFNFRNDGRRGEEEEEVTGDNQVEEEVQDANDNHAHGRGEALGLGFFDGRRGKTGLPVKPDTCDGTTDCDEYLSHFELCAELGRWQEYEMTLSLAASFRGPARTFYISLITRDKRTYEGLVNELGQRVGSTRQQNRWLSRFESRTRQSGESIAALGDDLRQMSKNAYPKLGSVAQEALALNQLFKSVSLEIKCRCIDRNCTTIAQAVDIIERYEAVLVDTGEKKKTTRMVTSGANQQGEMRDVLERLSQRLEQLEGRLTSSAGYRNDWRREQNMYTDQRLCFICKSPSHFMRNCPQSRQNQYRNGGRQSGQNQGNDKPSSK